MPEDDPVSPAEPPAEWIEALRRSDADLAAGRLVPGSVVLAELRASVERLEAKLTAKADQTG